MKHTRVFLYGVLVAVLALTLFWAGTAYATTGCFTDTNGHPMETFICWMKDKGITTGFADGTYRPELGLTRAQMAVFLKKSVDVPPSLGDIYISTGPSNWVVNTVSVPTAYIQPYYGWSHFHANANGTFLYSLSPSLPSSLYNTKMYIKGVKLCYGATQTGAYITAVELKELRYDNTGFIEITQNDPTDLTDMGCHTVSFTTPSAFGGSDQLTINVYVTFSDTTKAVYVGLATVILSPSADPAFLDAPGIQPDMVAPAVNDPASGK